MKKRFLIIGSNSFSGSNIINLLLSKNHQVVGVSRSNEIEKVFLNYKHNKNIKKFKFYKIDINKHSQRIKLNDIISKFKPNVIINYLAQGMVEQSWINPEDWYQTNIVSQTIFYKNIQKFRFINRIIHVTTPEVYGSNYKKIKENTKFNPSTPYAISRAAMDLHLLSLYKNFHLPIILTRTSNIYGPGQQLYRIIPKAFMCSKKKLKLNLHGGGNSIRSFIFMDDVSEATYMLSQKGKIGETYHISNNEFISIKKLVLVISKMQNISFKELCHKEADRIGKDKVYKLNFDKLKKLNWKPKVKLNKGLSTTKKWIDNNFNSLMKKELHYKHKK